MFGFFRDGNYAKTVGEIFMKMKKEDLSAVFLKITSEAHPPSQNLATVLLYLADYCLKQKLYEDCEKACTVYIL